MTTAAVAAATLLLLRDGPVGPEVFMVVRHHQIDAFSGALVFPGGKLDDRDRDPALRACCSANPTLSVELTAHAVGAIRETFEESGVLLARAAGQSEMLNAERSASLGHHRQALCDGSTSMLDLCRGEQLVLAVDALVRSAHWITPARRAKRFDTQFFVARTPPGQVARHDGVEALDSMWLTPAAAIAKAEAGELNVVFPTRLTLLQIAASATVDDAVQAAAARRVVAVQPEVAAHADGNVMTIPAGAGYGCSRFLFSRDGRRLQALDE